jgi:hypothetical protein
MSLSSQMLATLRPMRRGVLVALLLATIGTNLIDFAAAPAPGGKPDIGFVAAAIVRIVAVLWVSYALQRHLAGGAQAFRPKPALARFVALQILLLAGFGLAMRLGTIMQGPGPAPLATQWLFAFLPTALYALFTIRLLAWNAALAMGEPFRALGGVWRGQSGYDVPICAAYLSIVLPLAAIHLAMTLIALKTVMSPNALLVLAVVDGLFQALQLGLTCALGALAWRIARGPIEAAQTAR